MKKLIWSDFGDKVGFFGRLKMFSGLVGLFGIMAFQSLQATQCQTLFILNLRFPNKYLVDNIPNEPEATCLHIIIWLQVLL